MRCWQEKMFVGHVPSLALMDGANVPWGCLWNPAAGRVLGGGLSSRGSSIFQTQTPIKEAGLQESIEGCMGSRLGARGLHKWEQNAMTFAVSTEMCSGASTAPSMQFASPCLGQPIERCMLGHVVAEGCISVGCGGVECCVRHAGPRLVSWRGPPRAAVCLGSVCGF